MVTRGRRPAWALLALAGCASSGADGGDEIARALAGRSPGEPSRCVPATGGEGLTIVAPGAVGYRSGDTLWVSRLGPACAGLRPMGILIVEAEAGRSCRGDRVRAIQAEGGVAGPACILGDFIPYRRAG